MGNHKLYGNIISVFRKETERLEIPAALIDYTNLQFPDIQTNIPHLSKTIPYLPKGNNCIFIVH